MIELKPAHFPGRAPIDAYGRGGFRFAEMSHRGSLLCLPSGIYSWEPVNVLDLGKRDLELVLREAAEIEILLIGSGMEQRLISPDLRAIFREHGISVDTMTTGAAVRTFNVLLAEDRAVAAAFVAVE